MVQELHECLENSETEFWSEVVDLNFIQLLNFYYNKLLDSTANYGTKTGGSSLLWCWFPRWQITVQFWKPTVSIIPSATNLSHKLDQFIVKFQGQGHDFHLPFNSLLYSYLTPLRWVGPPNSTKVPSLYKMFSASNTCASSLISSLPESIPAGPST